MAEVPVQIGVLGEVSGRQRLQGRKPLASALAAVWWNSTFLNFGLGAGQMGRQ